jgi:hypothetical protein
MAQNCESIGIDLWIAQGANAGFDVFWRIMFGSVVMNRNGYGE